MKRYNLRAYNFVIYCRFSINWYI